MGGKRRVLAILSSAGLLASFAVLAPAPAEATSVTPIFVAGNPSCAGLGYAFGYKVDPPVTGTYSIDGLSTVTVTTDGVHFDWSSAIGMDAVIAKGGPNANVYVYDPPAEALSDTGLHGPIDPGDGQPFGLLHVEVCFDYEVAVSKTVNPSFTRTNHWSIDKSAAPAAWDLFTGDSGTSRYTVEVQRTGFTDSDWGVAGTISVSNPAPVAATVTGVADSAGGVPLAVDCGVSLPFTLAAGATLQCPYQGSLPDGSARTNTATATTTGSVGGGSGTASVVFSSPTTIVNGGVTVVDSNGASWQFADSGTVSYDRTFTCDGDEGSHANTAAIVETGQSASASVDVTCHQLVVTKGVTAGFTRQWSWTLDKAADQTALVLADGQLFQVNYQVTATATATDSAYAATGGISITNPHPTRAAQLTAVNDIASPGILGVVDCPTLTVAPAGTVQCTYAVDLPSGDPRLNTAVATRQAFSYDPSGTGTPAGTTDVTATAAVTFAGPTAEIDECVDVTDTDLGVLGTVCAGDAPTTFAYSLAFGRHADADVVLDCLENTHVNTASLVANDSGATASASWTVDATVACATGCTLTQGYWKTHSSLGPAPYDDAWASLGDADGDGVAEGADERFFTSGRTWYQVLWTSSTTPYYSLAHHYAAARLNVANGASSTTAVDAALAWAETFFATHSPASKLSKAEKSQLTAVATTLARYNLGLIGPGHCTE